MFVDRQSSLRTRGPRWLYRLAASTVLPLVSSCSLVVLEAAPCESDAECEQEFGPGAVCESSGFCEVSDEESAGEACASNPDCLATEGFGSACNLEATADPASGLCEPISVPSRCAGRSFPADLAGAPEDDPQRFVVGVVSDRAFRGDTDREDAIELAFAQINENSGLDGTSFGVVFCDIGQGLAGGYSDGLSRPDAAVEVTDWLINEASVSAIIGAPSSGDTSLIFEDVANRPDVRGQTLVISASSSDPSLVDFDVPARGAATDNNPGILWRTAGDGSAQIDLLVEDMGARDLGRVAVVREQSPFAGTQQATGGSFAQAFVDAWPQEAQQFAYTGGSSSGREQEVREVIAAVAKGSFDTILFVGPTSDAQAFVAQVSGEAEFPAEVAIYFGDTGSSDEVFDTAADTRLFASVRATRPLPDQGFEYDSFAEAFSTRYGRDPARSTYTAAAYDAAWFVALGAAWALFQGEDTLSDNASGLPVVRGEDIGRGMRQTTTGTAVQFLPTEWTKILAQFRAARPVDVTGAASTYAFDLGDEQAPANAELVVGTSEGTYQPL